MGWEELPLREAGKARRAPLAGRPSGNGARSGYFFAVKKLSGTFWLNL